MGRNVRAVLGCVNERWAHIWLDRVANWRIWYGRASKLRFWFTYRHAHVSAVSVNRMKSPSWLVFAIALLGCGTKPPAQTCFTATSLRQAKPLAVIEDNYEAARALAGKRKVPLVVEAWAPWCHTCRSLREVVMRDPQIVNLGDVVQFASIDVDRKENEAFLERFPIQSLPTILIFDANDDVPALKWLGALTVEEFETLIRGRKRDDRDPFALGDAASAVGDNQRAIRAYRMSLADLKVGSPEEARVVDSLVARLSEMGAHVECLRVARERQVALRNGTSRANVIAAGLQSAIELEESGTDAMPELEQAALALARDPKAKLLADDRSALFETVVEAMKARKADGAALRAIALEWSVFLEESAAHALGRAQMVFDAHRTIAYLELGEFEKAQKMLEASVTSDPNDYNPHARLAAVHLAAGHMSEGLAAVERALALSYGPRKLRIHKTKIELLEKSHDSRGEWNAIRVALAYAKTVKLTPRHERLLFAWRQRELKLAPMIGPM